MDYSHLTHEPNVTGLKLISLLAELTCMKLGWFVVVTLALFAPIGTPAVLSMNDDVPLWELMNCRLGSLDACFVSFADPFSSLGLTSKGWAWLLFVSRKRSSIRLWIWYKISSCDRLKCSPWAPLALKGGGDEDDDCKLSSRCLSSWIKSARWSKLEFASLSNPIDWILSSPPLAINAYKST